MLKKWINSSRRAQKEIGQFVNQVHILFGCGLKFCKILRIADTSQGHLKERQIDL